MALTEQDKIECREIARQIVKEVMLEHINSCPHGRSLGYYRYMVAGICIGTGLASFAGSTVAIGIAKMFLAG